MKKVLFLALAAGVFTFTSCDSKQENQTEQNAEQVEDAAEAQGEAIEEAGEAHADSVDAAH